MINYEGLNKHREDYYNEMINMIKNNDRVGSVQATGIGKSYTIMRLCNELEGNKIVLEPTREVINYMKKFGIKPKNTKFITYHSLLKPDILDLIKEFENYTYIMLDEMHRVPTKNWGAKLFNIFDALEALNNKPKILGFSATPIRGDGIDVIDKIFHGIQTKPYYLSDAILDNLLPMPNYHCGIYEITNEQKQKMILKDEQLAKQILEYDIDESISQMIKDNLDFNKEHKIICFVDRVNNIPKAAENVIKWFGINNINMFEVNHKQSKKKTQEIIDKFTSTNGINVMFCVDILNEGVHLPGVDCAIFLRKTKSGIIYNQQLGRVIKDNIEEPVIFDLVNNAENPEWGYVSMFEEEAKKQNKEIKDLKIKNGDKLKITLEQIDLIEKLKTINSYSPYAFVITNDIKNWLIKNSDKYTLNEIVKNIKEIFNKDINTHTIIGCLKNNNLKYKYKYDKKDYDKIGEYILQNKHKTIQEIADDLNEPYTVIKYACNKYNISCNNNFIKEEDIEYVKDNYKNKTILQMSKEINRCKQSISKIIKQEKLDYYKYHNKVISSRIIMSNCQENFIKNLIDKSEYTNITKIYNEFIEKFGNICSKGYLERYIKKNYDIKIEKFDKYNYLINWLKENAKNLFLNECSKILNTPTTTLKRICNENNIEYKKDNSKYFLNENNINFILNNYFKNTIREMTYNMFPDTIKNEKLYLQRSRLIREFCTRNNLKYKKEHQKYLTQIATEKIIKEKENIRNQISKELLYKIYIEENHTFKDTRKILNNNYNIKISEENLRKRMKELNIIKSYSLVVSNGWKTRNKNL